MIVSQGKTTVLPDSLGDSTPLLAGGNYWPQSMLELTGLFASYGAMYRTQIWVYTLVRKVGTSAARLPFTPYTGGLEAPEAMDPGQPLAQLLARPNDRMDPVTFWSWTASTYELYGEAIWWKIRDPQSKRVVALWPLHPSNVDVRLNSDGTTEYIHMAGVRVGSPLPPISSDDIVHFKTYNPDGTHRGLSFLEPLRQTLIAEDSGRRAQSALFRNGSRPSVILTHPNQISSAAATRLQKGWDAIHSGVDSWAKTAILEEGMQPVPIQMSMEDLQYIESRKLSREECCAAADIPPPVVHILDHATFSNITEQMRSMYRDTMAPRLSDWESTVNHQLVPDFAKTTDGVFTRFDLTEVLRGDWETRITTNATAIESGQMLVNEARKDLKLPPVKGGDMPLVKNTSVPLEDAGLVKKFPTPDLPATVPNEPGVTIPADSTQKAARMVRTRIRNKSYPIENLLDGVDDEATAELVLKSIILGELPARIDHRLKELCS